MIHLPRFLCIRNDSCFAGTLSRQIVHTHTIVEEIVVFLLSPPFSCCQSSSCNGVMITCSIHEIGEVYSCKNLCVIHHFWWNNPFMVFGLHEYRPIYRFQTYAVEAMRPILTREFSFQLVLGFCTLSLSQYWKYNVPTRWSRFFTCDI